MSFDYGSILDAGNDIMNAVNKAVESGDYSKLGREITDSIGNATIDVAEQIGDSIANAQANAKNSAQAARNAAERSHQQHTLDYYQTVNKVRAPKQSTPFLQAKVSKNTGLVEYVGGMTGTIAGGIATASTAAVTVIGFIADPIIGAASVVMPLIFGALTAASAVLLHKGKKKKSLIQKYFEYGRLIGPAEFIEIEKLAAKANKSTAQVKNDLYDFKEQGLLPMAKLDGAETTLMLTDKSYNQYLQAEEGRRAREAEESKWNTVGAGANEYQKDAAKSLIASGNKYIEHIREVNAMIPEEEMTEKLSRLEHILGRIFEKVRQQPQSATDLRRFMDYYLPTTDKLLSAYVDLEKQPEGLENVDKTKREIKDALDKINDGFEKLLNRLFEELAMDISSDISVMNTMMKQDGLVEDPNFPKPEPTLKF